MIVPVDGIEEDFRDRVHSCFPVGIPHGHFPDIGIPFGETIQIPPVRGKVDSLVLQLVGGHDCGNERVLQRFLGERQVPENGGKQRADGILVLVGLHDGILLMVVLPFTQEDIVELLPPVFRLECNSQPVELGSDILPVLHLFFSLIDPFIVERRADEMVIEYGAGTVDKDAVGDPEVVHHLIDDE